MSDGDRWFRRDYVRVQEDRNMWCEKYADVKARLATLEAVVAAARKVAQTYPWYPGNSDARRENFYAIEELQVALAALDQARDAG